MRVIFLFLFLSFSCSSDLYSQTWQSISKTGTFQTSPLEQFVINPYNNEIWLINENKVGMIESDGTIHVFTQADLGNLWTGDQIKFVFTSNETFYNRKVYGLYSFNNFSSQMINSSVADYLSMSSNYDTLYITMASSGGYRKYSNGSTYYYAQNFDEIHAKNNNFYGFSNNSYIYSFDQSSLISTSLITDDQYLVGFINDVKFTRKTDSLFVACNLGISIAKNYDFLDTITINNTTNMPSSNVLEIEFDANDSLWAVFGDVNNDPVSIAKLEGNSWTNFIDNTNSPIDFSTFLGLEIDTLGNLWVADLNSLHTLISPNSPQWLNTLELENGLKLEIYPNPSKNEIIIKNLKDYEKIEIIDLQGRILNEIHEGFILTTNQLNSGKYFIRILNNKNYTYLTFIKE